MGQHREALEAWGEMLGLGGDVDDYCWVLQRVGINVPAVEPIPPEDVRGFKPNEPALKIDQGRPRCFFQLFQTN